MDGAMTGDWKLTKVKTTSASEVCRELDLTGAARELLTVELTPAEYLKVLMDRSLFTDAVRVLARALPKREAVWWACLCARKGIEGDAVSLQAAIVQDAEQWVYRPTEENRRKAMAAVDKSRFDSAADWAAAAAAWSGGSMAPPDCPMVLPPDDLTAKAVANAVMLAAVGGIPRSIADNYRFFFRQGIDIAQGGTGRIQSV